MSDIETHLARVVPWPSSAQPGFISIHYPFLLPNNPRPQYPGRAFIDHQNACRYTRWMLGRQTDLFVCMSLQGQAKPDKDKSGRPVMRAIRAEANAVLLRSFWVDVDIKDGFFRGTGHAIDEFNAWIGRTGLPPPTLYVFTGSGGFHAYWVLDEAITKAVWEPVAYALAQAVLDPTDGLHPLPDATGKPRKLDVGVTTDAARILRIAGTYNYKTKPSPTVLSTPKPYNYTLDQIETPLARFKGTYTPRVSLPPVVGGLAFGRVAPAFYAIRQQLAALPALNAGVDSWVPELEDVMAACPFIKRTKETGGAGQSQPLWFEALKVAYYCRDGLAVAHELSEGYATYNDAEVDQKFHEVSQSHANGRIGWPQCRTIQSAGAHECANCHHFVKNQSPLNFAAPPALTPAVSPSVLQQAMPQPGPLPLPVPGQPVDWGDLPPGYWHDKDGLIFTEEDDEDNPGSKVRVYVHETVPIYKMWAQRKDAPNTVSAINFKAEVFPGQVDDFQIPFPDIMVLADFTACLGAQSFVFTPAEIRRMQKMVISFAERLRFKKFVPATANYGWAETGGVYDGFCYDRLRFNGSAPQPVVPSDAEIDQNYRSVGDFQKWKDACDLIINQQRPDLDTIITGSLAAPLVVMTGLSGFVMSCYSPQSGLGKTHAMRVAQAIWGHPTRGLGGLDDTANFIMHRVSTLRHLPFLFDEVKLTNDVERLLRVVLSLGQGKGKGRLSRDSKQMPVYDFNTLMIAASNSSLVDHIAAQSRTTPAGLQRVFEWRVQPRHGDLGRVDAAVVMQANGDLSNNFGHAGRMWAQFLGRDPDRIKRDMGDAISAIHTAVGATDDERYWVAAVACNWMAAKWAAQQGIVHIDEDRIGNFLVEKYRSQRRNRDAAKLDITSTGTTEAFIGQYVNARRASMVTTDIMWRQGNRPPVGSVVLVQGPQSVDLRAQLSMHYATNDKLLRISVADFSRWLEFDRHVNREMIVRAVQETLPCTMISARIGVGTSYKTAREQVMEFDLTKMTNLDFD